MAIEVETPDARNRMVSGWDGFKLSMRTFAELTVYLLLVAPAAALGSAWAWARTVGRVTAAVAFMVTQTAAGIIIGLIFWSVMDYVARAVFERLRDDQQAMAAVLVAHVLGGMLIGAYIRYFSDVEVQSYRKALKEYADKYGAEDEEWTDHLDHEHDD